MSINDKISAFNGIVIFLSNNTDKIDIGSPKTKSYRQHDIWINNILIKFLKSKGIKYFKNNSPRYRGNYSPVLSNSVLVQENWNDFKNWLFENYSVEKYDI